MIETNFRSMMIKYINITMIFTKCEFYAPFSLRVVDDIVIVIIIIIIDTQVLTPPLKVDS